MTRARGIPITPLAMLAMLAALGLAAASPGCREKDAMEEAKQALRDDPEKAIEILEAKMRQDPNDFEAIVGLAQGYKVLKNHERTIAWYRKALAHPRGQDRAQRSAFLNEILVAIRLVIAAERTGHPEKLPGLLKEANAIEQELGIQNIEAGKELFEMARSRFDALVAAQKLEEALGELESVESIYCEPTAKQALLDRAPELRREGFRRVALAAFETDLKDAYLQKGVYSADQKAFTFSARAVVQIGAEGSPDPTSAEFAREVEARGCNIRAFEAALTATLSPFAQVTVLGRALTKPEIATLHRLAKKNRKTRWDGEAWDATRGYDDGTRLTLVCEDSLPLSLVIDAFEVLMTKDSAQQP